MTDLYFRCESKENERTASSAEKELKKLYYKLYHGVPCLEPCFSMLLKGIRRFSVSGDAHFGQLSPSVMKDDAVGMVLHADTFVDHVEDLENKIPYFLETGISFLHLFSLPGAEAEAPLARFFESCHRQGIRICVSVPLLFYCPSALNRTVSDMLFYIRLGADMMYPDTIPGQRMKSSVLQILKIVRDLVSPGFLLVGETTRYGIDMQGECSLLYGTTSTASVWNAVATEDVGLLRHDLEVSLSGRNCARSLNFLRRQDLLNWELDFYFLQRKGLDERVHRHFLNDFFTGIFPGSFSRGSLFHPGSFSTSSGLCGTTASFCGIEKYGFEGNRKGVSVSVDLILMLHALIFSMPGYPVICSGDEIGMVNDYSYRRDKELLSDDRYLHHSRFRWDQAERRFRGGTVQNRLYSFILKLIRIRTEHKDLFVSSSLRPADTWSRSVFGIIRETETEKFIGLYNFRREDDIAWINEEDGLYRDLLTDAVMEAKGITMKPFSSLWLFKKK